MRSHEDYTIGWICALPLEMTAAKAMLDDIHADLPNPHTDNNTYTLGRIHGHNVVITCLPSGGYGTISATAVISHLKSTFPKVHYGLMVGIGGGVPSKDTDIRLGDVVVSHPMGTVGGVVQYDLGKTGISGDSQRTGMLNQPPRILLTAIARLRSDKMMKNSNTILETVMEIFDKHLDMKKQFSKPQEVGDRLFLPTYVHPNQEKTCSRCDSKQLIQRNPRTSTEPKVYYGIIASGNQVIKDGQYRDRIAKEVNALCFEMEAAGIMNQLPCLVVRGICDYCDSHKNKDWQGYAALTAAAFSKELLSVVPVSLTGETNRRISETPEGKACLQDLYLTDTVEDKDALKRKKGDRASGTCSWILDTFELKIWLGDIQTPSNYSNILWLYGLPGKGKSTMAITLVEELPNTPFFASGQKMLAYFFCDSSSEDRTTATGILRGLLYQLVRQRPELLWFILPKYNDRKEKLFSSFDSLWGIFMDFVNDTATGSKYIIIDALDECEPGSQETLLKQFRQSFRPSISGYTSTNIRILVTSRPHPEIMEYLEQFNNKDLSSFDESKRDMELFISERVSQLKARKKYTKKIADEVTRILKQNEEGTFLWIGIACDELDKIQSKDVIQYLKCLPSGLYSLYQRLLDRCVQNNLDEAKIKRLLSVITVSRRLLSVSELSLACELYMDEEEEERLVFTRDEIHSCRLLVIIRDDKVQLLHKSAKDFLMGSDNQHFINEPKAHAMLAYRCVDHLLQHSHTSNTEQNKTDTLNDSFLMYSAEFWPEHAHLAKKDFAVVPSQADFFNPNSRQMEVWLNLSGLPPDYSIFHVAARWNILELLHYAIPMEGLQRLSDRQPMVYNKTEYHDNDFADGDGVTPLQVAVIFDHIAIFSALLQRLNKSAVINERVVVTAARSRSSKEFMTLLLGQRRDQIPITEEVVKAAIHNYKIGKEIIKVLLEQREGQIPITEEVIKAAITNPGVMAVLLEQRGDQIPITEEVVKAALWSPRTMTVLLEQRGDQIPITEEVVKAALWNYGEMIVLPEQQGGQFPTLEEVPEALVRNQRSGVETMAILLNRGYIDSHISPELIRLTVQFQPVKLVRLLLHRLGKYVSITTEVMVAATRNERHSKEMITLLLDHQIDPDFFIEEVLQEAAYNKRNALHVMALLLGRQNGQITITVQLVMAIATNQWKSRNQLMLLLLSKRYSHAFATSPKVVELIARWFDGEVMTLFLNRLGSQVIITEKVIMAAEQNKQCGGRLKMILASLTNQGREQPSATGEMVMAKANEANPADAISQGLKNFVADINKPSSLNIGTPHDIPTLEPQISSVTPLPSFYASHILYDHSDQVWVSEFSHSGSQLATGSKDGSIIIYDTSSFTVIRTLCEYDRHNSGGWISAISWSLDDTKLISSCWNGTIRMWNVTNGDLAFHCYQRKVTSVIFSIDCKTFISSSVDNPPLCHWSDSGKVLYSWSENLKFDLCTLTPDGTRLIAVDVKGRIHVYDFQSREKKFTLSFRTQLSSITVSNDSRYILVNLSSSEIQLVYLTEKRLIRRFRGLQESDYKIRCIFLGSDEKLVMSGNEDSRIYIWDRDSGEILDILEGHTGCVNSVSFNHANPDIFASTGDDGTVRIWKKKHNFLVKEYIPNLHI